MSNPIPAGDYYGLEGLFVESLGQLHTDIYGLSSATAVYVSPSDNIKYPAMYSAHPLWSFLRMERRTVSMEYGFCRTTAEYAGFEGVPIPVIEYSSGVSEEPIQTHINFSSFAGTPSNPLNGAIFIDPDTQQISTDDSLAVFDKFWSNPPNEFSGVTSYLLPVLIKRVTQLAATPLIVDGVVGRLFGNLLCTAASCTQRGIVYQNVTEYREAGPRGWNHSIYS